MRKYLSKISRALLIGLTALLLASFAIELTSFGVSVSASQNGISVSTAQYGKPFVSVSLDKTYAYAKLNKSGCQVAKDGLIYLRYDLFLLPQAVRYADYHVTVIDETSKEYNAGYTGAKDKSGNPTNQSDYQVWLDSLPTIVRDNPFLCVFVVVPTSATLNTIQPAVNNFLNKAYASYEQYGSAVYCASVIRADLKAAKTASVVADSAKSKSNQEKYNSLVSITSQSSVDTFNPSGSEITVSIGIDTTELVAATTIDVGAEASDRTSAFLGGYTIINLTNPANDTGTLDTVEIFAASSYALTDCKVGTFSGSGTSYDDRDYETIGAVTDGSKQTFTGLSIGVTSGDFIGTYFTNGRIEQSGSGYSGIYYVSGDKFNSGSSTYTVASGDAISLYATGDTGGVAAPTNVAATDGTYTDKVVVTWTKSVGANAYKVLRGATNDSGTLGDVATYDDTAAAAPAITAGAAVATDGTATDKISLSLSGTSVANGTTEAYTVYASSDGGASWSAASIADNGYRGHGDLTYQWQKSASTTDDTYSDIGGATAATYDDSAAPAPTITAGTASATDGTATDKITLSIAGESANNGAVRYYKCILNATGAAQATSSSNAGYRGVGALAYQWYRSSGDADSDYSSLGGATTDPYNDSAAPAGTVTAGTASATDGTQTTKVVLSIAGASANNGAGRYYYCTLSATGASNAGTTHDRGYRGIGSLTYQWKVSAGDSDATFGDIAGGTTAPYDYTSAPAGTITAGTATASDGTSSAHVTLTLAGASVADGAGRYYYCVVSATGAAASADTTHDRGYRTTGALTYQWQRSAADSDATFSDIAGATTNPYNDIVAPSGTVTVTTELFRGFGLDWIILEGNTAAGAGASGRYYLCVVSATGATPANSTHDRGYKGATSITEWGFDYGLTTAYGSDSTVTGTLAAGQPFVATIRGLTAGTVYHFRAKANAGGWNYGADLYVCTKGSPVVYEYLNTGNDDDSAAIYESNFTAMQFTAQTTSHTVTSIKLFIKRVGAPGTITVGLYHANVAHEPTGDPIASWSGSANSFSTSYFWMTFEMDVEVPITGSAEYAIVVKATDGDASNYVMIAADSGGSLANAVGLHSTDGSSTWTSDSPVDYLFEIWGNSAILVKSGFAYPNYITTGDILFALEGLNIYPPDVDTDTNRPTQSPMTRYLVRLLDTDGVTVLASTPLVWYGDAPASIYIGAAQASTLTLGGAYYLEIYGNFTGNPSASYQLLSTDWSGGIGGWVLQTAYSMETYYSTVTVPVSFTTFSSVVSSDVLNDDSSGGGGTIFAAGIPYLMETHPELFISQVIQPSFTPPASQVAPLAGVWQNQVGANISGLFTTIGTMLGISGKYIGTALLLILWLMLPLAVGSRGGTPFVALVLGFPILALGVWLYLIDFVFIASIILVVAVITFIGLWVTRT